jgi:hypothetical protein
MSLDFEFTSEQEMIEEVVWRWASSWLEPQMEELYEKDQMPPDLFKELGKSASTASYLRRNTVVRVSGMWRPSSSTKPSGG